MASILITNANIVNEGHVFESDIFIKGGFIDSIGKDLSMKKADQVIDAQGAYVFPGVIDDQVHFREPGLTHKADIASESRAAVAGGVTSFMEMPNTNPLTITNELLEEKYSIAVKTSAANYSFFLGATNDNFEEIARVDKKNVCGIKIFMGSSTGNMLVDQEAVLERIFSSTEMLIATHCEDEQTIRRNTELYREKYGEDVPIKCHPEIRSREACFLSSSKAVALAKKHNTRLHVLHISTKDELKLFNNTIPLDEKRITAEACVHHMWFSDADYKEKGTLIKWNPAVKTSEDRAAIIKAVANGTIDVVATDHAPHTWDEKQNNYFKAPSGGPLIQHSLIAMLDLHLLGHFTITDIAEKMCHNPARIFNVEKRGFIREGYWADLAIVDLSKKTKVTKSSLLYKCKWSPFEGHTFNSGVTHTIVSGTLAYQAGKIIEPAHGQRLVFNR